MRFLITLIAASLLLFAALLGGTSSFGRVFLAFGMPKIAASIFPDPAWQGVAHYRAGNFDEAASAFAKAGPDAAFNLGNAEVQRGFYAAALEAFDLAQAYRPDPMARANFDLLRAFYAGTEIEAGSVLLSPERDGPIAQAPVARGSAVASGTGDEVTNTGAALAQAELESHGRLGVRRVFDDTFIAANDRWLATLEDVPGAYLAARIAHEHRRRQTAGTGQVPQETPW